MSKINGARKIGLKGLVGIIDGSKKLLSDDSTANTFSTIGYYDKDNKFKKLGENTKIFSEEGKSYEIVSTNDLYKIRSI